jgi:hypothetical protein
MFLRLGLEHAHMRHNSAMLMPRHNPTFSCLSSCYGAVMCHGCCLQGYLGVCATAWHARQCCSHSPSFEVLCQHEKPVSTLLGTAILQCVKQRPKCMTDAASHEESGMLDAADASEMSITDLLLIRDTLLCLLAHCATLLPHLHSCCREHTCNKRHSFASLPHNWARR